MVRLLSEAFKQLADRSQDAKFRYVNPEFVRITGYGEEELLDTYPLDIVQEEYRQQVRDNFIAMLKSLRQSPYEFCITDKNGKTRWILETASSIRYRGKRAALGYFMDISEAKQTQKERIAKEKLLSVLEMAGAIGHELNNPLQVILTCAEKMAPGSDKDELQTTLYKLLTNNVEKMRKAILKFQNITRYATKDYVRGKKIIDIDAASGSK